VSEGRKPYDIDSLTDVALRVFAERGYDGASMDDVARAAGISKASIYHHVESKEALLARGLERALDALFAVLSEPGADRGPAVQRLAFIVRRAAETTLALLPELSVLFRLRANSRAAREAIVRRRSFDRAVAELIAQAQAEGDVRSDIDPAVAARLVFGMSNSVAEWYRADGQLNAGEVASAVETLALDGLRALTADRLSRTR
jgi:AcrR family transcriptional regulator